MAEFLDFLCLLLYFLNTSMGLTVSAQSSISPLSMWVAKISFTIFNRSPLLCSSSLIDLCCIAETCCPMDVKNYCNCSPTKRPSSRCAWLPMPVRFQCANTAWTSTIKCSCNMIIFKGSVLKMLDCQEFSNIANIITVTPQW